MSPLLAIPNCSAGRDPALIGQLARAFGPGVLDIHADPDHNRSVFTITGAPGALAGQVLGGARAAVALIDMRHQTGEHPRVGALDVAPVVYLEEADRGAACAEALVLADRLGEELALPVFLYGLLGGGRTRAELRRGGPRRLAERVADGELTPDFGPRDRLHPSAGAVLVAARPPLVAFNLELAAPATLADAKRIAALIRESAEEGLPGVRAIGVWLAHRGIAQVSTNVEDHRVTRLADVVGAVAGHAPVSAVEIVGLPPQAALEGFPPELVPPDLRVLEDALLAVAGEAH